MCDDSHDKSSNAMNEGLQVFDKGRGRACVIGARKDFSRGKCARSVAGRADRRSSFRAANWHGRHSTSTTTMEPPFPADSFAVCETRSTRSTAPSPSHSMITAGALDEGTCSSPSDRHRRTGARHADDARRRAARSEAYQAPAAAAARCWWSTTPKR